jgi:hypothetical protein
MRRAVPRLPDAAVVVLLCGLALLTLYPVLSAGFVLVDDHEILRYSSAARENPDLAPAPGLGEWLTNDVMAGRTRPMYVLIRYAQIALLDANTAAWHSLYVGIAVISASLLYATLRGISTGMVWSVLAAAWLVVAPGTSSVWIRLGPQEGLGCCLVLGAAFGAARGSHDRSSAAWDWLFAVALSAAILMKETFALVPPGVVAFRVLLRYRAAGLEGLTRRRFVISSLVPLIVGLLALILAIAAAWRAGSRAYGGPILETIGTSSEERMITNVIILAGLGGAVVPLLGLGLFSLLATRRLSLEAIRLWAVGALIVCLLVLPQLVVYRTWGGFTVGRYAVPAAVALAAGIAVGSDWLRRHGARFLNAVVAGAWVVSLAVFSVMTRRDAEIFRADSDRLARTIDAALAGTPSGATLVIAADPVETYEASISLAYHLAARGRHDYSVWLLLTPGDPREGSLQATREALVDVHFRGRTNFVGRSCADTLVVVLFVSETAARAGWPCLTLAEYHQVSFEVLVNVSGGMPAWMQVVAPPTTIGYALLVRSTRARPPSPGG